MIISKCPLRISLLGGSTDLDSFIQKYGRGSVISFASNLNTYISIHDDKMGFNNFDKKYVLNYSKREETLDVRKINNDVARVVLEHFKISPLTCLFTSDVFSQGSGLASSSSYLIAFIKSITIKQQIEMSDFEICKLALALERKFNALTGQQDPYGCGMGGFKRFDFFADRDPSISYLPTEFLNQIDMLLVYTGINRSSTRILKTIRKEKTLEMLDDVEDAYTSILNNDLSGFLDAFNNSWFSKKDSSPEIVKNKHILSLDDSFYKDKNILGHKLCGAGNGGYFLLLMKKGTLPRDLECQSKVISVRINGTGVTGLKI